MAKHKSKKGGKGGPNEQKGGSIEDLTNALLREAGIDPSGSGDVIDKATESLTKNITGDQDTTQKQTPPPTTTRPTTTTDTREQTNQKKSNLEKLQNLDERVNKAREAGTTDTEIIDFLEKSVPEIEGDIKKLRQQTNDREALNTLSEQFAGQKPSTPSVPTEEQVSGETEDLEGQPEQDEGVVGSAVDFVSDTASGLVESGKERLGQLGNIASDALTLGDTEEEGLKGAAQEARQFTQASGRALGVLGGAVMDVGDEVAGQAIEEAKETELGSQIIGGIEQKAEEAIRSKHGQRVADLIKQGGEAWQQFKKENPEVAKDAKAIARIGGGAAELAGAKGAGTVTSRLGKEAADSGVARTIGDTKETISEVSKKAKETTGDLVEKGKKKVDAGIEKRRIKKQAQQEREAELQALPDEGRKATELGVSVRDVKTVTEADRDDLKSFDEMLEKAKQFETDRSLENDPARIVGRPFVERMKFVEKQKDKVGKQLGETVEDIPRTKLPDVEDRVLNRMKQQSGLSGLKINEKGDLDFSDTTLSGPKSEKARKSIREEFRDIKNRDAKQLHKKRQELFEEIGGRQSSGIKLTGTEERGLNAIRQGIADSLSDVSSEYKTLNREYAKSTSLLEETRKKLRDPEGEIQEDLLEQSAATLGRRLTGRARTRTDIENLLRRLDEFTQARGGDTGPDVRDLQNFYNAINRYFDIQPDTGAAKQIGPDGEEVSSVLRDPKGAVMDKLFEKVGGQFVADEETAKAGLEALLKQRLNVIDTQ